MYIPRPYFAKVPNLGDLELDYIFMEDGYPLLFTCKSKDRLYICVCRTLSPKQKWVISETNVEILENMVRKIIPISAAFRLLNAHSWIITWSKETDHEYFDFPTSDLNDQDLPSYNVFLNDDDADDAIEYISSLKPQTSIVPIPYNKSNFVCAVSLEHGFIKPNVTINDIPSSKINDDWFDANHIIYNFEEKPKMSFVIEYLRYSEEKKVQFAKKVGIRLPSFISDVKRNSLDLYALCENIVNIDKEVVW